MVAILGSYVGFYGGTQAARLQQLHADERAAIAEMGSIHTMTIRINHLNLEMTKSVAQLDGIFNSSQRAADSPQQAKSNLRELSSSAEKGTKLSEPAWEIAGKSSSTLSDQFVNFLILSDEFREDVVALAQRQDDIATALVDPKYPNADEIIFSVGGTLVEGRKLVCLADDIDEMFREAVNRDPSIAEQQVYDCDKKDGQAD
jgi:hypothetical protein